MSHRLLRPSFLAVSSLVLVAGGLAAAGCGSDAKDPEMTGEMLEPEGENPGNGNGGSGASSSPGNNVAPGNNGGSTGTSTEGQGGSAPIDNDPTNPPAGNNGGTSDTGEPPVDPPVGAAPNCNPADGAVPNLTLELVADGLNQPLYVTGVRSDDSRLFVVEKAGAVRVVLDGELQQAPFINISGQVQNQGERGLLGLAFHPNYQTNGLFYLHWSSNQAATAGDGIVAEFSRDANDPNVGSPGSQRNLIVFDDPEGNHNGGDLQFGPDGFLYIGMGDGGGANDQHGAVGNGQNLNTLFGKMLRIDPTGRANGAYTVPPGNFAQATGQQALPEIWASGLRNPWRFSFDACTGDLYIADVGQNTLEEVNYVAAAADTRTIAAGLNFGWRIMEGGICRPNEANCNAQTQAGLVLPVDTYPRDVGTSITGGFVYRGADVPGLRGHYIYADYNSARFFRFRMNSGALTERVEITNQMRPAGGGNLDNIASFGTDNAGEMYVAAFTPGAVYRVAPAQ